MTDSTFEQRVKLLFAYGFTVDERQPHIQANYPGRFMVVECLEEYSADESGEGEGNTWVIVGDDLPALVSEAFDFAMGMFDRAEEALALIKVGGTGIFGDRS